MTKIQKPGAILTLSELFSQARFTVPDYQRSYAWRRANVATFMDDLEFQVSSHAGVGGGREVKPYFLGTLLLAETNKPNVFDVVDGQQRLTTSVIFFAAASKLISELGPADDKYAITERFLIKSDNTQALKTIRVDNEFFENEILVGTSRGITSETAASKRLSGAYKTIRDRLNEANVTVLAEMLAASKVMVYVVDAAAEATQIFELQNDRGLPLTPLESLKSYLMHSIYLYGDARTEDRLEHVRESFSAIYRICERHERKEGFPGEDAVLSAHCLAFLEWTDRKAARDPKSMVKVMLNEISPSDKVTKIIDFVTALRQSYQAVGTLLENRTPKSSDTSTPLSELLLLGRMRAFWPLLIKLQRRHDIKVNRGVIDLVARHTEKFAFRAYSIIGRRADTAEKDFAEMARDYSGDVDALVRRIVSVSEKYGQLDLFIRNIGVANAYTEYGKDLRYFLWRYENSLRGRTGRQTPEITWVQYLEQTSRGRELSIEHIHAQRTKPRTSKVSWDGETKRGTFEELYLHRIGNLVLDTRSSNASKGTKAIKDKWKSLSRDSAMLSQGELYEYIASDQNRFRWDRDEIRARQAALIEFAERTWT